MLGLNIFMFLKVKFAVIYSVFTVNVPWSEMTELCTADAKLSQCKPVLNQSMTAGALAHKQLDSDAEISEWPTSFWQNVSINQNFDVKYSLNTIQFISDNTTIRYPQ